MPRGGKREGAGRPSAWKHKETKLVRLPVAILDQLLDIAYKLDSGEPLDFVTDSKPASTPSSLAGQMSVWDVDFVEDVSEELRFPARADGGRWLTTAQAFDRAVSRGCQRNLNGFKGWSQRSPEECLEEYGLRRLDHKSNSRTAPGYEDTLWKSS